MVLDGPVSATVKFSSLKPTVNISLLLWLWVRPFAPSLVTEKKTDSSAWKQPRESQGPRGRRKTAKLTVAGVQKTGKPA